MKSFGIKKRNGKVLPKGKNVTGIGKLSIGCTVNSKGYLLKRYSVNYTDKYNLKTAKSFYFGARRPQKKAFYEACDFLVELGLFDGNRQKMNRIYKQFKHESLIQQSICENFLL